MTDTTTAVRADTLRDMLALGAVHTEPFYGDAATAADAMVSVVPDGYTVQVTDLSPYKVEPPAPRRIKGTITVTDMVSWLAYFAKYRTDDAEIFGDVRTARITALLNAPTPGMPAYGDHRAVLQLSHSAAWLAWVTNHGKLLTQTAFAEHLEDRSPDLREPDAASMLEIASSIKATKGLDFESGSTLHDGSRRFTYREKMEAKAGTRGQLEIPTEIKILVQVWRGVEIYVPMTARFRYRVTAEGLNLAYILDRLEDTLDAAWADLLRTLTDALPVTVLAGPAPSYASS
jgi:uncharacterized protein YfdQ (DUF2303 family)